MPGSLGLALPQLLASHPAFSLTSPFTPRTLISIRRTLKHALQNSKPLRTEKTELNAAVLVPFANINGLPGVILELRGKLRHHAGEVSFPGGHIEDRDPSFLAGALRETDEEIALKPAQVEILGEFGPPERSLSGLRVWPYVGFVHRHSPPSISIDDTKQLHSNTASKNNNTFIDLDAPLPSLSMSSMHASAPEVARIFHLPFSQIIQSERLRAHKFRGQRPYWAINVTDIVSSSATNDGRRSVEGDDKKPLERTGETRVDEVGGGGEGRLEVWGLTGWYLNLLMRALCVYV